MTTVRLAEAGGPLLQVCCVAAEANPGAAAPATSWVPPVWSGESAQSTSYGSCAAPDESAKVPLVPLPVAVTE
jgi:hypothetical protein